MAATKPSDTFLGLTSSGWEFVSRDKVTTAASVNFTGLDTNYDYELTGDDIRPSAGASIHLRYGTGATPTWQTSNYEGQCGRFLTTTSGSDPITSAAYINLNHGGASWSANAADGGSLELLLHDPNTAVKTMCAWSCRSHVNTSARYDIFYGAARWDSATAVTAFQLYPSTGTLNGNFTLYRRKVTA
ncbi:MAG: hypothetical protein VW443_02900 [Pseudomonadales bacterium]